MLHDTQSPAPSVAGARYEHSGPVVPGHAAIRHPVPLPGASKRFFCRGIAWVISTSLLTDNQRQIASSLFTANEPASTASQKPTNAPYPSNKMDTLSSNANSSGGSGLPLVSQEFDFEDSDITLKSSDGVLFKVHVCKLAGAS